MANQYKGEIKGKLGDKERTFRLTFESIVSIENRTGKSILDSNNLLIAINNVEISVLNNHDTVIKNGDVISIISISHGG